MPYPKKGECRNTGRTRFKKGYIPWHKGKKCPQLSGENNPNWKGGKYISFQGYVMILVPNHPFPDHPDSYVKRCRLIMEKKIGRFLKPKEEVHHINGNKTDDRPENLQLFVNKSEHMKHHKNHIKLFHKNPPFISEQR